MHQEQGVGSNFELVILQFRERFIVSSQQQILIEIRNSS